MAIVQNPITGRTKQKFASAVFSKQFGKNTMRSKPIEVKNPKTPDQLNQRSKFKLMIAEARQLLGLVRVSFQNGAIGMSAFNAFISQNILNAITGVYPSYTIDYPNLMVSKGTLLKSTGFHAGAALAKTVKRTWDPPIDPLDPINDDLLVCASYNIDKKQWIYGFTTTKRIIGTHDQTVPDAWVGDDVHAFSFFINPTKTKCCDSDYSGQVTIL